MRAARGSAERATSGGDDGQPCHYGQRNPWSLPHETQNLGRQVHGPE